MVDRLWVAIRSPEPASFVDLVKLINRPRLPGWVGISHLHLDHVGGPGTGVAGGSRSLSRWSPGVPTYVPTAIRHDRAEVVVRTAPRVIAPGMAVLPPLPHVM